MLSEQVNVEISPRRYMIMDGKDGYVTDSMEYWYGDGPIISEYVPLQGVLHLLMRSRHAVDI